MSKVKACKSNIILLVNSNYGGIDQAIDELIQAVRDEEFELHQASERYNIAKCIRKDTKGCDTCPAKGTKYCP